MKRFILSLSLGLLAAYAAAGAQAPGAPRYKFDSDWPQLPLPNKWKLGGITGLAVDKNEDVWVMSRPSDLRDMELQAELDPPIAACCVRAPTMIHIDKAGKVIGSFDTAQGHGMDVDSKGFIYIGSDTVRKYDPATGKVMATVPRTPDFEGGRGTVGTGEPAKYTPGRGSIGPVGTIPPQGGGRGADPAAQAAQAAAVAA